MAGVVAEIWAVYSGVARLIRRVWARETREPRRLRRGFMTVGKGGVAPTLLLLFFLDMAPHTDGDQRNDDSPDKANDFHEKALNSV